MSIDQIASTILEKLREMARTETVVGKAIETEKATLIPVSKVTVGFGLGGNTGKSESSASGGGASVEPIAFIVITDNGVEVQTLTRNKDVISKVVDIIPQAIEKIGNRGKKEKSSKSEDKEKD